MNFQENKFPIVLGVVTAVAAGGLIFWSMKSGSRYEAAKQDFDQADSKIRSLMSGPVDPTPDNLVGKKKAVENYEEAVAELQQAFDPLRRPELVNVEPSAFTDELIAARGRLQKAFEEAGTEIPEAFFLGHGRFSDTPPLQKDTGVLMFELGAFEELFTKLAKAAPSSLDNVFWPGIPEPPEDGDVVAHPIEITFTGSESSVRAFLSALDDGGKHYHAVRVMRVKNERDTAPNASDARFEETSPEPAAGGNAADPFGGAGFVFPEDTEPAAPDDGGTAPEEVPEEAPAPEPEPEPETDSSEILKQVLGTEKVQVFLRIDVLQFLEPREL